MTVLEPVDLRDAELAVAIANTPLFLARRLYENPAVKRALDVHGAEKIFNALRSIIERKPQTLNQATEAYFYLAALSFSEDLSWLRKASKFNAHYIKWFKGISEYLISTARPTVTLSLQSHSLQAPPKPIVDPPQFRNPTANTSTSLIIRP
jgi:hypothetical protein